MVGRLGSEDLVDGHYQAPLSHHHSLGVPVVPLVNTMAATVCGVGGRVERCDVVVLLAQLPYVAVGVQLHVVVRGVVLARGLAL